MSSAQTSGSSTTMEFVFPFLTFAETMMTAVLALTASEDTTLSTVNVFSHPPTSKGLLRLAAKFGTGTTKSVLSAHLSGMLTPTENAQKFQPSVPLMTPMETVLLATVDSSLTMATARLLLVSLFLTLAARLLRTMSALNALSSSSLMPTESAFPYLTSAELMT